MLRQYNNIFFLGIGGIGMSALARYFHQQGYQVGGYDKVETDLTRELNGKGMEIHYQEALSNIPLIYLDPTETLVIYTPAIPDNHIELKYFRSHGFTLMKRAEVLGLITKETYCFAVAGTHGKTTTSCILAHLLKEAGIPFTAFLGGISEDFNSNYVSLGDSYSVVEADEFDRSFLHLSPDVACITSMDPDHLDIYGGQEALADSYRAFAKCLKSPGTLFVYSGLPIEGLTYGIDDDSDYCIRNLRVADGGYIYDMDTPSESIKDVRFKKPGRHNVLNSLVAYAMANQVVEDHAVLVDALSRFKGVERRFSYRIHQDDFVFIDDYAHHPTEIDAVYEAIREVHPGKEVLAVFQPHLFSRTKDFGDEFAKSLSKFDTVVLLEIYPAREEPIAGIDSSWLLEKIKNPNKKLIQKKELAEEIKAAKPEILVTMGAGDIGMEIAELEKELIDAN